MHPQKKVLFVAQCYFNQIRSFQGGSPEERRVNIGIVEATIIETAQMYGARENVPRFVISECVRLVFEKYSFLALEEIREAYRQKAAGEIKIKGAEMYGGVFNADNLGKVLRAYNQERKKVMAAFLKEKHEMETKGKKEAMKLFRAILFEVCFPEMLKQASQTFEDWRQVPEWWYDAAKKRELFIYKQGEKRSYYERAIELMPEEIEKEEKQALEEAGGIKMFVTQRKRPPERVAASIARKLVVFEKLICK